VVVDLKAKRGNWNPPPNAAALLPPYYGVILVVNKGYITEEQKERGFLKSSALIQNFVPQRNGNPLQLVKHFTLVKK
jgi:hypothetical protein